MSGKLYTNAQMLEGGFGGRGAKVIVHGRGEGDAWIIKHRFDAQDRFDLLDENGRLVASSTHPVPLSQHAFDCGAQTVAHNYDLGVIK